ncbi:hypothetical protein ACAX43_32305 [Paraburkholderia sp. IW21]|uniref:hypothetical protein n=1 Tax=Paraburkholderia sp. IW21 TaxID=3242488 RepID=UPI003520637E
MDAATWLTCSREVAGTIMRVPQKRARGVLESREKTFVQNPRCWGNRSPEVKPLVASLTTWRTWHEAVEVAQQSLRFWGARVARAVQASLDYLGALVDETSSRRAVSSVCIVERRHFYAFEYPGRKPNRIKFSRLIELAEAT